MMDPPCQTCRARRKACDRSRPKCQTCIKANRQCGGYSSRRNKVFVNIDSHSIKAPKKPIIGKAITLAKQNRESSTHTYSHANFHCTSLQILDLPAVDFQSHFTTLWTQFNEKYGRTSDVWSAGLMKLGLQNQALDLALISLAAMRLSISERQNTYLVFSLSAYSVSLRIFRQLLQDSRQKRYPSNLVVTSLIFTLFEGSQQTPTRIYKSGWAGHLKGTLALMQGQSPESFQEEGLLAAFKRIREMAVHFSLSTRQATFLAQPEWLELPWRNRTKTPRDYLYDIATNLTAIYAFLPRLDVEKRLIDSREALKFQTLCCQLYSELIQWQEIHLGLESHCLQVTRNNTCREIGNFSCFPSPSLFQSEELSFLIAELLALLLLLTLAEHKITQSMQSATPQGLKGHDTIRLEELSQQSEHLQQNLRAVLCLPCFGQAVSDLPGLTEGRCRSLLPTWALAQCSAVSEHEQIGWWDTLALRLLYGLS